MGTGSNENESRKERWFFALATFDEEPVDGDNRQYVTLDSLAEDGLYLLRELPLRYLGRYVDELPPQLLLLRCLRADFSRHTKEPEGANFLWLRVLVSAQSDGDGVPAEVVQYADEVEVPTVWINRFEPVGRGFVDHWEFLTEIRYTQPSTPSLVAGVLDHAMRDADFVSVGVFDVGQGSCSAILDEACSPRVYYDLGWPANFNGKSRPAHKPGILDFGRAAPVIISHWDMDHWAFAIEGMKYDRAELAMRPVWKDEALHRVWIAPNPRKTGHPVGPFLQSLLWALEYEELMPGINALQLLPDDLTYIDLTWGRLEVCEPPAGVEPNRNNTGLALWVYGPENQMMLLTGDADFNCIAGLSAKRRRRLVGMVVPHHGARVTATDVPKPAFHEDGYAVVSVGGPNVYGHPKQDAINSYLAKRWNVRYTKRRRPCQYCEDGRPHGNIRMLFDENPPFGTCNGFGYDSICLHPVSLEFEEIEELE